MQVGPAPDVIVLRVSYSGELGYELYLPPEHQIPLFLALRREGADLGLRCAGRALALGYVRSDAIASNAAYDVEVIGEPRPARRLDRPPIDPDGERMRG